MNILERKVRTFSMPLNKRARGEDGTRHKQSQHMKRN